MSKATLFCNCATVVFNCNYYVLDENGTRVSEPYPFQSQADEKADFLTRKYGVKYTVEMAA